ncbi:hypothetical protein S245_037648, partial [Arachis hypogaea]
LSPPPPRHPSLSPSSSPQRHSLSRPCGSQSTHRHVALTGTLHQGARRLRRRCFFPWRRARQCHLVLVTSYRRRLHHLVAGCRLFSVGSAILWTSAYSTTFKANNSTRVGGGK